MEYQDAEKNACSSHDVIDSVSRNLKFYLEVRRREDGFDTSPSYIPRRAYPNLLPRPMLMSTPKDRPMKHYFSHAQIRSVLARLQSYQPHKSLAADDKRGEKVKRQIEKRLFRMKIDHPMWFANREYDIRDDMHRIWLKEQARMAGIQGLPIPRNRQPLRNGLKTIVRAPPPYASSDEKQRLISSACELIRGTERISSAPPKKYMEVGNTKLQNLAYPTPLQRSYTADIHRRFVTSTPRYVPDSAIIKSGKNRYVYDLHGRRNKIVLLPEKNESSEDSAISSAS